MFNFDDQAAYDLSPSWWICISLDGRFLAVIVTPNPCPRHVCFMSVTKEIHVNDPISMDRMLLIGKNSPMKGF